MYFSLHILLFLNLNIFSYVFSYVDTFCSHEIMAFPLFLIFLFVIFHNSLRSVCTDNCCIVSTDIIRPKNFLRIYLHCGLYDFFFNIFEYLKCLMKIMEALTPSIYCFFCRCRFLFCFFFYFYKADKPDLRLKYLLPWHFFLQIFICPLTIM